MTRSRRTQLLAGQSQPAPPDSGPAGPVSTRLSGDLRRQFGAAAPARDGTTPSTPAPGDKAPPASRPLDEHEEEVDAGEVIEALALGSEGHSARPLFVALFGGRPKVAGDWDHVRGLLVPPPRQVDLLRPAINFVGKALGAFLLVPFVDPFLLIGIVGLSIMLSLTVWKRTQARATVGARTLTARDMRNLGWQGMLNALPWALLFGLSGPLPSAVVVTLAGLMAVETMGAVLLGGAMPTAITAFSLLGGGWAAARLIADGHYLLATIIVFLGIVLAAMATSAAIMRVQLRIARIGLREKRETVRLLLREFTETSADWLWQTDASRRLTQVSPRLAKALARPAAELEGMPFLKALAGDQWEAGAFAPALRTLANQMSQQTHFTNLLIPVTIAGEQRWCELSASPRTDHQGRFVGYRGVGSDVTDAQVSAQKIQHMAQFDGLTGLPNRQQLTERLGLALQRAVADGRRCALLMLDLDRFKAVNDTLGHPVGDQLLAAVAGRLQGLVRQGQLCGRLGGDEFAVLVEDARSNDDLIAIGERIIASLSAPYMIDSHHIYVGTSVGFAVGPADGSSVDTLTRNADLALYRAKDEGGGIVCRYERTLHQNAEERRVMEAELRTALEHDQLALHYQPVVNAADGTLDGFEALLRWTSPTLGPVSPAKFIPIAEDARLIGPMGEWVLRTACHQAARWPANLKVAVNVSADQLCDPGFAAMVVSALGQSGLAPQRLELEVTESVFLRDGGQAARALEQLLALGIRLSLDDFGTGYSSLGYLHKTRFSTIKIDRSFVQGATRSKPESLAIIRAVVALAEGLGMATTAEGAETEDEVATIRALGCTKIQGYYYGKPMSTVDVDRLFNRHAPAPAAAA